MIRSNMRSASYVGHRQFMAMLLLLLLTAPAVATASTTASTSSWLRSSPHNHRQEESLERLLQQTATQSCTESCCQQYIPSTQQEESAFSVIPAAAQFALIIILLLLSAAFSGLTLGIMGLDKTGLEIIMDGGDPVNAARARNIYPYRKRGNLLLCSLLLGNVGVNALLSILLADKAGGLVGFLVSTMVIVIFGEIIPQALCSRYSLAIGSASVPLVKVVLVLLFVIAYPLSWILNKILGKEIATTYSTAELMKLLQIHVSENALDPEIAVAMTGALKYKNVAVRDVMTPVEKIYMLSVDDKLNHETMAQIFKTGFSRIPVYEVDKNNVIGILFVKDLIFVDPEDGTRVSDIIDIFSRSIHVAWIDDNLGDVLRELKKGRSHMALIRDVNNADETDDPYYELKGIITLEDIIEEILGEEIVDETDVAEKLRNAAEEYDETTRWARLRLLDSKIVEQNLSHDEVRAVAAHLSHNYPDVVSLLTANQLHRLIAETPVTDLPTAGQLVGQPLAKDLLYDHGVTTDFATLLLSGKMTVVAGADNFRSDVSNWCLLGRKALTDSSYQPDFSAFVSDGPCRCICIKRARFASAVDASALEKRALNNGGSGSFRDITPQASPMTDEANQRDRELGKGGRSLTSLGSADRSSLSETLQDSQNLSTSTEMPINRRPSLINMATVPRSDSSPLKRKGST